MIKMSLQLTSFWLSLQWVVAVDGNHLATLVRIGSAGLIVYMYIKCTSNATPTRTPCHLPLSLSLSLFVTATCHRICINKSKLIYLPHFCATPHSLPFATLWPAGRRFSCLPYNIYLYIFFVSLLRFSALPRRKNGLIVSRAVDGASLLFVCAKKKNEKNCI